MNRILWTPMVLAALAALPGCALFDAPPAAAPPPAAAAAALPRPPLPPPIAVSTPYPVAVAAPEAAAQAAPGLQPGPAHAAQPSMLRLRPQAAAQVEQYIPAGASLRLQVRQVNGDGAWWFADYQGGNGWVSELGLSQ